jgi:hypothetical protein
MQAGMKHTSLARGRIYHVILLAEELGDSTANAKLLQFDRHRTVPVPEMPLQLMGSVLDNSILEERPFAPL